MLKIGIIGAGQIAYDHCGSIQSYPDVEVRAVADISKERREKLCETYGIPVSYTHLTLPTN